MAGKSSFTTHPPPDRSAAWRDRRFWIGVFLLALVLRIIYLWQLHGSPLPGVLMGDAAQYDAWARRIAEGQWIGRDVFYQSPLYPYFMGAIYTLCGPSLLAVRAVQLLLGSLACVLLGQAGESFFTRTTGRVAALILAGYPTAIFFDGLIQKSCLDLFLVSLVLYAMGRLTRRETRPGWLGLGVALGLLALNRENALLLVPVLLLWALQPWKGATPRPWKRRGLALLPLVCGLAIPLIPVTIRNAANDGGLHITTAQSGPNFYIGNHAGATGIYAPLRWGRSDASFERQDATELAQEALGRKLTPSEVSTYWFDKAWQFIREHPGEWAGQLLRKWSLTWNQVEIVDTEDPYAWAEESPLLWGLTVVLHFGVLAPIAAAGLVVSCSRHRKALVLAALMLVYALSVTAFYVFARYRYPLLPMVILFASAALAAPWRSLLGERRLATVIAALLLAVAVSVWVNRPMLSVDQMTATTHSNLGVYLAQHHQPAAAERHFVRAIEINPGLAEGFYNLGVFYSQSGHWREAVNCLQQAAQLAPDAKEVRDALRTAEEQLKRAGTPLSGAGDPGQPKVR